MDEYRECNYLGDDVMCDGLNHYWAVFDEDTNRWYPIDGSCPHRSHNREVLAEERIADLEALDPEDIRGELV